MDHNLLQITTISTIFYLTLAATIIYESWLIIPSMLSWFTIPYIAESKNISLMFVLKSQIECIKTSEWLKENKYYE